MQRKLMVDGSGLWDNPEEQFVLRFNDINQERQNKLAQRLKKSSQRQRVRNETYGPTIDEIVSLLKEINPIIHTEGKKRIEYGQWKRWNKNYVQTLSGWYFRKLDLIIYRFLCLNRPPTRYEIETALWLSTAGINNDSLISPADAIHLLLDPIIQENNETTNTPPPEIGIEEVRSARERTERRNPEIINF